MSQLVRTKAHTWAVHPFMEHINAQATGRTVTRGMMICQGLQGLAHSRPSLAKSVSNSAPSPPPAGVQGS